MCTPKVVPFISIVLVKVPLICDYLLPNLASDRKKLKLNTRSCDVEGNFEFPFAFDFVQVENIGCSTFITDFLTKESFKLHFIEPSNVLDVQITENELYFAMKDGSFKDSPGLEKIWLICFDYLKKVSFHISIFISP